MLEWTRMDLKKTENKCLEIQGIFVQIIKKPIKNIHLRIYPPDGTVKMTVPLGCTQAFIRECLQKKMAWIQTQRERIQNTTIPQDKSLQTGAAVEFLGKQYLLIIQEHNGPSTICLQDQLLMCYLQPQSAPMQAQALIERWYRREMTALIPNLIHHWEAIIQVKVYEWGIKKMKTRWGSCNTRAARIWLNLNLIKKPIECLEYVLVHEMVHLLEPSHNKRFYSLMSKFLPNWKDQQRVLKY